uniref:non-specific serine/threonine protein kinase n=1 Tax=Fagus sylvatica TaxID=28930 RepID=A0A2N9I4A1_FAGSY
MTHMESVSSWNDSIQFCNWHGVTCGRRHQRVTALELEGHNLRGTITPYIGNLTFLRKINLRNNSFYGEIPKEVGQLIRLQHLKFSNNMLGGEIPASLTNCSDLRVIEIYLNKLIGNIPMELGSLTKLFSLKVGANHLTGGIPPSLGNLSLLLEFSVVYNNLEGNIPESIGHLKSLEVFTVGVNKLAGMIPSSLYNISSISYFVLAGNQFIGTLPANIGLTLPNLQTFFIGENEFYGSIPGSLCNASRLGELDLSQNKFVGSVPTNLGNLIDLELLNIHGNNLGRELDFLTSLRNCSKLEVLDFAENQFEGVIPTYFGKFQKMQRMYLWGNRLSGKIPKSLGNLTQLGELFLGNNNLEGSIPPSIGNCPKFAGVECFTKITLGGVIPRQAICKNIYSLDVSENNLSGEIPATIGNCFSLEHLYLEGNFFKGIIPSSMGSLKGLRLLDVSRNNLSGLIPKGLEKLSFLKYLNLSFNDIEGELPTEGVFKNVSMISVIGNNKLCGGIPQLQLPTCLKAKKSRKSLASRLRITIVCVVTCFLLVSSLLVLYWRIKSKKKPSSQVSKMDLLPNISYKMLHQATNGFSLNNLIGSGSFGSVYKGVLDQEERLVAVKVLNLERKGAPKSFVAECNVLRNVRHRNLIKILTCCSSINYNGDEFKALVFEFMTNGNLDMWLHPMTDSENQSKNLSVLQRLIIAIDVASALNYLHDHCEQQIIHCDLKPSNILLDNEMIAHVSDFGLARLLSTNSDSSQKRTSTIGLMGSIGYAAPEYGMGADASTMGDVYSYGILVLEMFTGRRPTDDMFKDGLNLHNFVKMALPKRLIHVVDPMLLPRETKEMGVATVAIVAIEEEDDKDSEIEVEANSIEDFRQIDADLKKCLLSILNIGIICSMESPQERMRMSMEAVIKELQLIKNAFDGSGIHKGA